MEYIIIDGGSTDNSIEIIKKYEDRIQYWVSERDNGQTNAINKGLKLVSGEIINWLNSDDILFPNALFNISEVFTRFPDASFVYGDTAQMREDGEILYIQKVIPFNKNIFIYGRILATQPSVFFRKEVIEKIGLLAEDYNFCMDLEFWGRAIRSNLNFVFSNTVISGNRFHGKTKTVNQQVILTNEHKRIQKEFNVFFMNFPAFLSSFLYEFLRFIFRIKWGITKMILRKDFGINRARKAKRSVIIK